MNKVAVHNVYAHANLVLRFFQNLSRTMGTQNSLSYVIKYTKLFFVFKLVWVASGYNNSSIATKSQNPITRLMSLLITIPYQFI